MATLTLTSISAERVPSGDTHSATDPYVRFALLNELGYFPTATRTSTLSNNANPVWTDTLKLTLPADWKGGSMKVCLWDADTKGDDDALGHCVVKLEPTDVPVEKTVVCEGHVQKGHGGYTVPPFKVYFTYTATNDVNPLAACLKSCMSCVPSGEEANKDAAAGLLQGQTMGFFSSQPPPTSSLDEGTPKRTSSGGLMKSVSGIFGGKSKAKSPAV